MPDGYDDPVTLANGLGVGGGLVPGFLLGQRLRVAFLTRGQRRGRLGPIAPRRPPTQPPRVRAGGSSAPERRSRRELPAGLVHATVRKRREKGRVVQVITSVVFGVWGCWECGCGGRG
jgi:hypothetical protein